MRAFPVIAAAVGSGIVGATLTLAVVLAPAPNRAPVDGRLVANEQTIETSTNAPAETTTSNPMPDLGYTTTTRPEPAASTSTTDEVPVTTPVATPSTTIVATTPQTPPPPAPVIVAPSTTRVHCVADPRVGHVCTGG